MFRIGEFSRLSRVSVKMLRHYDELGLLPPARVDDATGYRYYSADQLPRLNRLLVLRDLGFTLQQVGPLLDDRVTAEQLVGMLTMKYAELERELDVQHARLRLIAGHLAQLRRASPPAYVVLVRPLPSQRVASIRLRTSARALTPQFEALERFAASRRIRADGPPLTVYHDPDYREEDADLEAAVPVTQPADGAEGIAVRELAPVPQAACVIHTGPYGSMDPAGAVLLAWVEANGHRIGGPIREVYLRFSAAGLELPLPPAFLTDSAAEFVTELQVPLEAG